MCVCVCVCECVRACVCVRIEQYHFRTAYITTRLDCRYWTVALCSVSYIYGPADFFHLRSGFERYK